MDKNTLDAIISYVFQGAGIFAALWPVLFSKTLPAILKGRGEVLEHAEPVPKSRTVALVDHDEIKEVRREVLEDLLAVQLFVEVLVIGEEDLADKVILILDGVAVDHDAVVF